MLVAEKDSTLLCIGVVHHLASGKDVLASGSCHIITHVVSGVIGELEYLELNRFCE